MKSFLISCGLLGGLQLASAQYLPGLVTQVPQLSTFFQLLNQTPALYAQVQPGGVTVLAPTNDAFKALNATEPNATSLSVDILLRYHILQGIHSGASLASSPTFLPTLLQDASYTNETGGERVEAMGIDGTGTIISALRAKSKIVTSDLFFVNGLVHSLDTVLSLPNQYVQTVTASNLTNYIALSEQTQLVQTSNLPLVSGAQVWPDLTVFAPNSPDYSSNFTGWANLSAEQALKVWHYHLINGTVVFSTNLTNGSTFQTSAGLNVTAYSVNGSTYVNDAKVTQPDLLHANGVIQVLDKPLDPNNTNARPALLTASNVPSQNTPNTPQTSTTASSGLSTGAKAGIGVGVGVGALAIIGLFAWLLLARRRKSRAAKESRSEQEKAETLVSSPEHPQSALSQADDTGVSEMDAKPSAGELPTKSNVHELSGQTRLMELEGDARRQEMP